MHWYLEEKEQERDESSQSMRIEPEGGSLSRTATITWVLECVTSKPVRSEWKVVQSPELCPRNLE